MKIKYLIMFFCIGCNSEINTVDPQASSSIEASKKNDFYLGEYELKKFPLKQFEIKDAWVEYVWFNKISLEKKSQYRSNEIQLDIAFNKYLSGEFKESEYMLSWVMKDGENNYLGLSNGVYVLPLRKQEIPDSIYIEICRFNSDRSLSVFSSFLLGKIANE